MKKTIMSLALVASLAFVGCSNDDSEQTCRTCEVLTIATELCDNGDGSLTVTALGETSTLSGDDLDGLTPEEYIEAFCSASDIFGEAK